MGYKPLHHALQTWFKCIYEFLGRLFFPHFSFLYLGEVFIMKAIIPLKLVGYELVKANSVLQVLLAIYHDLYLMHACGIIVNYFT